MLHKTKYKSKHKKSIITKVEFFTKRFHCLPVIILKAIHWARINPIKASIPFNTTYYHAVVKFHISIMLPIYTTTDISIDSSAFIIHLQSVLHSKI